MQSARPLTPHMVRNTETMSHFGFTRSRQSKLSCTIRREGEREKRRTDEIHLQAPPVEVLQELKGFFRLLSANQIQIEIDGVKRGEWRGRTYARADNPKREERLESERLFQA